MPKLSSTPIRVFVKTTLSLALTLTLSAQSVLAAPAPRTAKRPKVGLVLAGGGALGMAHVGVLKVLEANRIPVHIITGTSMGSIVGAGYASGATVSEMEQLLSETDWDALFDETFKRPNVEYRDKSGRLNQIFGGAKIGIKGGDIARFTGVVGGQRVLPLLQRLYYRTPGEVDFDSLPIPYRAVAADIETGQPVVIAHGDLARAARASMAVPGFFTPVEIEGKTVVDGGIANNLPVDIALELGAEKLIVVDLLADLKTKEQLGGVLGISGQIISLLLEQNSRLQRKLMRPGDLLLVPDLKGYSATDFKKASEIFAKGETVALENLEALKAFAVSEEEYSEYQQSRVTSSDKPVVITALRIDSEIEALKPKLERVLAPQVNAPLDTKAIEESIDSIYRHGDLSSLSYSVERSGDGTNTADLVVSAKKATWYDQYAQVGLSLQDNFQGENAYQLAFGGRLNELNSAGAFLDGRFEIGWRPLVEFDFYQPLYQGSSYFVNPIVTYDRYQIPIRLNGQSIAEYQRERVIAGLGFGRKLGDSGEIQTGVRRGSADLSREIGASTLPEYSYEVGNYFGSLVIDSRDTVDFPQAGVSMYLEGTRNTKALGSTDEFTQLTGGATKPINFGANTVLISSDFGTNFETIPPERVYVLGGLFDISGYQPGGVTASDFFIGRLGYYRELASLGGAFAKLNLFGGGSVEYASLRSDIAVINDNTDIVGASLFVGADTPIVPVYIAAGGNNDDEFSFYLNLGRIFRARR
jgi:NTE family protein